MVILKRRAVVRLAADFALDCRFRRQFWRRRSGD